MYHSINNTNTSQTEHKGNEGVSSGSPIQPAIPPNIQQPQPYNPLQQQYMYQQKQQHEYQHPSYQYQQQQQQQQPKFQQQYAMNQNPQEVKNDETSSFLTLIDTMRKDLNSLREKVEKTNIDNQNLSETVKKLSDEKEKIESLVQQQLDMVKKLEKENEFLKNRMDELNKTIQKKQDTGSFVSITKNDQSIYVAQSAKEIKLMNSIGKGTYGVVYKAYHMTLGIIAIKIISNISSDQKMFDIMKEKEVKALKLMRSPYLVTFYGAFPSESDGNLMIAMEYMNQGSLGDFLYHAGGKLSKEEKNHILKDIIRGIEAMHTNEPQIIHRDLKSMNILLKKTEDGIFHAKISDFGTAKFKSLSEATNSFGTIPGTLNSEAGTLFWMAPECFMDADGLTEKSDIYSFAIILYEVFTEKPPYHNKTFKNELEFKFFITNGGRPEIGPDSKIPMELETLIQKCWHSDPNTRPSASEIKNYLTKWFG